MLIYMCTAPHTCWNYIYVFRPRLKGATKTKCNFSVPHPAPFQPKRRFLNEKTQEVLEVFRIMRYSDGLRTGVMSYGPSFKTSFTVLAARYQSSDAIKQSRSPNSNRLFIIITIFISVWTSKLGVKRKKQWLRTAWRCLSTLTSQQRVAGQSTMKMRTDTCALAQHRWTWPYSAL